MANYAYVQKIKPALTKEAIFPLVESAVRDVLGPRWRVEWAPFTDPFADGGPTILVTVPGTSECVDAYWGEMNRGNPPEDVGFTLSLQDERTIAFRHSLNMEFARWAQGCIEEELSERLKAPLYYDAGPTTYEPGRREYRRGKTLREYLLRNFGGKVEEPELVQMLEGLMRGTPPGFET